jgi:hypothetical protein
MDLAPFSPTRAAKFMPQFRSARYSLVRSFTPMKTDSTLYFKDHVCRVAWAKGKGRSEQRPAFSPVLFVASLLTAAFFTPKLLSQRVSRQVSDNQTIEMTLYHLNDALLQKACA